MIDITYRFVPGLRRDQPAPANAEDARHRLEAGNRAFAELLTAAPGGQPAAPRIIPFDLRELGIAADTGEALIETTILFNAALAAYTLQAELSGKAATGCRVAYGVYDLVTHRVGLPAHAGADSGVRLVAPPRDREDFIQLAAQLASGAGVRRSLAAS